MSYPEGMKKKSANKKSPVAAPEMGKFMLAVRNSRGMSQRVFAESVGKTYAYIHNLEHGKVKYPVETVKVLTREQKEAAFAIMCKSLKEEIGL